MMRDFFRFKCDILRLPPSSHTRTVFMGEGLRTCFATDARHHLF